MSNVVEISGAVTKLEANKFGFYQVNLKGDDGNWHNNISLGIKEPPKSFGKGDRVKLSYDPDKYNNLVGKPEVLPKESGGSSGGGYKGKSGGFSGGGKKFVDNSIGMGIGAALNNAVQLLINGKIKEGDLPQAISSLYTFSEAAKAAATEGNLESAMAEYSFELLPKASPKKAAAAASKKQSPAKQEEPVPPSDPDMDDD